MQTQASSPAPNRFLDLSLKLYQRLLRAYPRTHRDEYGGAMVQLFRDQCRDAWSEGRSWGLAALWLRILPDLLKTSFIERWSNFNPGKFMADKFNAFLGPRHSPSFVFFTVFVIVFFLVFSAVVITTLMLPKVYASTARIKVDSDQAPVSAATGAPDSVNQIYDPYFLQTTFEIMQSQLVLSNVISALDLNEKWGKKYYGGKPLTIAKTMDLLKRRMDLRTVRNTKLVSITVYSDDPAEAADVANAVAKSYQAYRQNSRQEVFNRGLQILKENDEETTRKITQCQGELETLREKFAIVDDSELEKDQTDLRSARHTCAAMEAQWSQLKGQSPEQLAEILPTITGDVMLSDLLQKLQSCRQTYVNLTNKYALTTPRVTRIASTIDELKNEINARVTGIMTALQSELSSRQKAAESLQASVVEITQNSGPPSIPTSENQPYWDKKNDLASLLDFQKGLQTQIKEQKVQMLSFPALVEFTDFAQPGDAPVKPNKSLDILLGAIAGILMGMAAGSFAMFLTARQEKRKAV